MPPDAQQIHALFTEAVSLHRQGRSGQALGLYRQVLALQPHHFDACHLGGVAALQLGEYAQSATLIEQALAINPNLAAAHSNYAITLQHMRRFGDAVASYDRALALDPVNADAHVNRGVALQALGRHDAACSAFERAIALKPGFAEAHHNLGTVLHDANRHAEAIERYDAALALRPGYAQAHYNRANARVALGEREAALSDYTAAVTADPGHAQAWFNRANALRTLGRHDAALADYDRALAVSPDYAEAWNNRGSCLRAMLRLDDAAASFRQAAALDPAHAGARCNLGICLRECGRHEDALQCFEQIIAGCPAHIEGRVQRGHTLKEMRRFDDALADYDVACRLAPGHPWLAGTLLEMKSRLCDWDGWAAQVAALAARIAHGDKAAVMFSVLTLLDDPALQLRAARTWARDRHPAVNTLPPLPPPQSRTAPRDKIRVGYFAAAFYNHAISHQLAGIFEHHDRARFEITAFSYGPAVRDAMHERVKASADHFIDLSHAGDEAATALARDRGIDIAIDLMGYTRDYRLGIFAARAAPLQAHYFGYPGTLGTDYIDYLIADRTVVPPHARGHYAENIVWLPGSCQPYDTRHARPSRVFTRAEAGLPPRGFVYACFNTSFKITPDVYSAWMRILSRVPGSVLWLYADSDTAKYNLLGEARRRGIGAERIVFCGRVAAADHAARLRLADVLLDTLPYGMHTTASDALSLGVPMVTCRGASFASRVGASLLTAAGLRELITDTLPAFEDTAVALAGDAGFLASVRGRVAAARSTSALFDTGRYTRNLERAFEAMLERHDAGLPPAPMEILEEIT